MGYQYPYGNQQYYPQPVLDQLSQFRQNQIQPMMQQPAQPQIAMPANQMMGNAQSGMIWVSGRPEADNYPVIPNNAVALWDINNPVIYLRKADSTGKPSTVVYDLVERVDSPTPQITQQVDLSRYVTIDQLDEILADRLRKPARAPKQKEEE